MTDSKIDEIKKKVKNAHDYFRDNYNRYTKSKKFVFESSLSADDISTLQGMNRPQLTFNRLEAYVSRLLGEFSKQEPDIQVTSYDEMQPADPHVIMFLEQHLKNVFSDPLNENIRYDVYKDLLSGGFSAVKVITDYDHPMSMNQSIRFQRCEPTLTGFDTLTRLPSKGDGRYCFELFPKTKDEFQAEFPDIKIDHLNFKPSFGSFNWNYINNKEDMIMVCDFYQKISKNQTIVRLSTGQIMTMKQYNQIVKSWDKFEQIPKIVQKRKTVTEKIMRYRLIEDQIIEEEETDFEMLPIVFIDGHSVMISTNDNGTVKQLTRPYVYHAMDTQRFIDFAGNSWAYELQNTISHKFIVAKESLPKEETFLSAYKNIQQSSTLVFNSVYEENPDMPIMNPIREVVRPPMPPEIAQAYMSADQNIQAILGSYDASLGINNNQLSGVAIVEAASQSNAAAMPYIVGCLQGFERLAQIYVHLIPKYYNTPRTIAILDEDNKRTSININNGQGSLDLNFDHNIFKVSLTAGASFQVQKSRTLNMIKELMGVSQQFAEFINMKGMNFLLDQVEGSGIEQLKQMTKEWQEEQQQKQQQMMQMQQQEQNQNSAQIRAEVDMQKLQVDDKHKQQQFELDVAKFELEKEKLAVNAELTQESLDIQAKKVVMDGSAQHDAHVLKHIDISKRNEHNKTKLNHDLIKSITERIHKNTGV